MIKNDKYAKYVPAATISNSKSFMLGKFFSHSPTHKFTTVVKYKARSIEFPDWKRNQEKWVRRIVIWILFPETALAGDDPKMLLKKINRLKLNGLISPGACWLLVPRVRTAVHRSGDGRLCPRPL